MEGNLSSDTSETHDEGYITWQGRANHSSDIDHLQTKHVPVITMIVLFLVGRSCLDMDHIQVGQPSKQQQFK